MRPIVWTLLVSSTFATSAPAQTSPDATAAPAATPTADAVGVGEIVVTAQRRSESLQKVPISVSAINSER